MEKMCFVCNIVIRGLKFETRNNKSHLILIKSNMFSSKRYEPGTLLQNSG